MVFVESLQLWNIHSVALSISMCTIKKKCTSEDICSTENYFLIKQILWKNCGNVFTIRVTALTRIKDSWVRVQTQHHQWNSFTVSFVGKLSQQSQKRTGRDRILSMWLLFLEPDF